MAGSAKPSSSTARRRSLRINSAGNVDDVKLSHPAKQWVQHALLNSDKKSLAIVAREARSLARNKRVKEQLLFGKWEGYRLLDFAVRNGHDILFNLLIEEFKADPNYQDPFNGISALHHAAATGQIKMIETLVEKYVCDTELKDSGNSTPLCFAISCGQNDSLRVLLKYGASVEVESFLGTPILLATHKGNIDAVRMLHEANDDVVNSELYGFCTPLVAAACYPSTDVFKYLLEAADVNAKHLMYKVICCSDSEKHALDRIGILLKCGVNPNFFDEYLQEELPVICAAKKDWKDVTEVLLIHTNQISGIEWSVEGLMHYVKSDQFLEMNRTQRENRVKVLKERVLSEIQSKNYLAADLICKALYVDMDREQWDWYCSLCALLILYGSGSLFLDCTVETISCIGMMMLKDGDENAVLAAKACMALDPENELCRAFYAQVEEKDKGASCSGRR